MEQDTQINAELGDSISPLFESRGMSAEGLSCSIRIKREASRMLSEIDAIPICQENARLVALAKTHLEDSVMWAVKAISREQQK